MSRLAISADVAAELYESEDGERSSDGQWARLAAQSRGSGRWEEHFWLVVTNGGGTFGIEYSIGLTEMQDHTLPWEERPDRPIELVPLVGVPVTSTEYLTEKQYQARLAKAGSDG